VLALVGQACGGSRVEVAEQAPAATSSPASVMEPSASSPAAAAAPPTTPASPPPSPAPPSPAPPSPAPPSFPGLEDLSKETPRPDGARPAAEFVAGKRFRDVNGDNFVFLLALRRPSAKRGGTVALYAHGVVREGERERPLWHARTVERDCFHHESTAQLAGSLAVTDLDADGVAEVRWVELFDCLEVQRPVQFVGRMIEGETRYDVHALVGAAGLVGEPVLEPRAADWPAGFGAALVAAVTAVAPAQAAKAIAGLPAELSGDVLVKQESVSYTEREVNRGRRVELRVAYPELRFGPASAASRLNRELAAFVGADEVYGPDLVGTHDGHCSVAVTTTQMVSVSCSLLVDVRTRREQDRGEGGAPAEPTRAAFNHWLLPGLPQVEPRELLGDVDVGACAPLLADGSFTFTREGLEFDTAATPDGPPTPACDEVGTIAYSDMKPRTARARQFVREASGEAASEGTDGPPAGADETE
jgi:hypothetical protein